MALWNKTLDTFALKIQYFTNPDQYTAAEIYQELISMKPSSSRETIIPSFGWQSITNKSFFISTTSFNIELIQGMLSC
jgi:hypothetical protein